MRRIVIVIAVMTVLTPSALWASDEISLEELAETVADLVTRVERIEAIWAGPGAIEVDGGCLIGMQDGLQDETVLKYKEQFDEWVDTDDIWPVQIKQEAETGYTVIVYADGIGMFSAYLVDEVWDGCDFVGSSEWRENDLR